MLELVLHFRCPGLRPFGSCGHHVCFPRLRFLGVAEVAGAERISGIEDSFPVRLFAAHALLYTWAWELPAGQRSARLPPPFPSSPPTPLARRRWRAAASLTAGRSRVETQLINRRVGHRRERRRTLCYPTVPKSVGQLASDMTTTGGGPKQYVFSKFQARAGGDCVPDFDGWGPNHFPTSTGGGCFWRSNHFPASTSHRFCRFLRPPPARQPSPKATPPLQMRPLPNPRQRDNTLCPPSLWEATAAPCWPCPR